MSRPQSIGDIIPRVIAKMGLTQKVKQAEIVEGWEDLVGKAVARHCQPVSLNKCYLTVNVDSSPWLNELKRFSKDTILQKLKDKMGRRMIKDIRFRIGSVNKDTEQ